MLRIKDPLLIFALGIIVVALLIHILLLIFTRFTRNITVETNMAYGSGSGRVAEVSNIVSDKEGRVYKVRNVPLLLQFRAAEAQAALKPGTSHTIRGYGVRVPFLGMYPTIYSVDT